MKIPVLLAFLSLGGPAALPLHAAEPASVEPAQAALTATQIDELLAPIALYPDPLVAIILPAATFPADIVMAARYLDAKRDPDAIEDQSWDDSVKALARYPDVVAWMDENLEWTRQLGEAFTLQPAAVLTGTQRLRASAIAAGNLKTTAEQTVIVEKEVVRIVPAQREVIYVPVYDPYLVYRPSVIHVHNPRPLVTFSVGYRTGFWLSYHCNWGVNSIVIVNRPYRAVVWHNHPGWIYPSHTVVHYHHVWRPAPVAARNVRRDYERRHDHHIVQPTVNVRVRRDTNREVNRTVNRTVNVNPAPRYDAGVRAPDDSRRQTRPENREFVRRPATAAPDPARTPATASTRERTERRLAERPTERGPSAVRTESERAGRTERTTDPTRAPRENRAVSTTPNPLLSRPAPALQPSRGFERVREPGQPATTRPRISETPRTSRSFPTTERNQPAAPRPPRVAPAPPPRSERAARPASQSRAARPPVAESPASVGAEEQTNRREFNRVR